MPLVMADRECGRLFPMHHSFVRAKQSARSDLHDQRKGKKEHLLHVRSVQLSIELNTKRGIGKSDFILLLS